MAKKDFGKELRRSTVKQKQPLDISAAENIEEKETKNQQEINSAEPTAKQKVHRTSINFPFEVYDAMLEHTFRRRITMKDYLVNLIKKDLNME